MIASHMIQSSAYSSNEMPLFLERCKSTLYAQNSVQDTSKRHGVSKKIVPLEEIVYIEGTVTVAF